MEKLDFVNTDLNELASEINSAGAKLYIVGGSVRDYLLGLKPKEIDVDLACSLEKTLAKQILIKCNFVVEPKNEEFGVYKISKNNLSYEYATFRTETYNKPNLHNPTKIEFTNNIMLDAARRDFTINSLYYDIMSGEILDFYNGIEDLRKRTIKTILSPQKILSVDPARILRMVAFVVRLDFAIDKETIKVAKEYTKNIDKLSETRKQKELEKIWNFDIYSNFKPKNARQKAINLLKELNINY